MREGDGRCAAGKVRHCCACSPRSAATKDDAWERRGPICWAGLGYPVSVGLQTATKSEGAASPARCQRHRPISSPSYFLPVLFPPHDGARMVRARARLICWSVGEIAGLAESGTFVGKSAHIVASIWTETGSLSFLAQP